MSKQLLLNGNLSLKDLDQFVFSRESYNNLSVSPALLEKTEKTHQVLIRLIQNKVPIYGVTTGFGDNCTNYVDQNLSEQLQTNLINYLTCGTGDYIPIEASRAMFLIRLNSLIQGISAVSSGLIEQMVTLLNHDIVPAVPREGSLGASGDLVPLAYLGQMIQGEGQAYYKNQLLDVKKLFQELNLKPYKLKPKEGLAIVNGTSTMAGLIFYNLKLANYLVDLVETTTSLQCLVLNGKREAFGKFINEVAKTNPGQALSARNISFMLDQENYFPKRGQEVKAEHITTDDFVQDRYSLRCVPQIMGPIRENIEHAWEHLKHEINSVSDNPVVDSEGYLEMGGNFYGGYLCQSMDFTKINLAHMADLIDRQVMMLVDGKSNRGLTMNLVNHDGLTEQERNMHHGLKGIHQSVSAITSEIIQRSIPSGIFSRSSESHNQDKVSLGMSAATSCYDMLQPMYRIMAMQLTCLAQATDLRKISLQGSKTKEIYNLVRSHIPFVKQDVSLGKSIVNLADSLKKQAFTRVQ